ncbi:hypothetical protein [Tsukamurella paurometabola]|uniref:Uncharacterized protein n=1 Tax=Tsukamurella paurometabola TaxID=2061 RepID=A0A3P8M9R6_TSUPA|nr:hypothetical protein [Tsukamurella paurometabola]MBS4101757.1 hypothetical protein [Tsukamurella paurometabola]UEA84777.1 hypothetical protein LK411_08150 [Tsukamurella paurometabola]VDR37360.1 Uncharacterised protein [Tsukamurella paurometabola]
MGPLLQLASDVAILAQDPQKPKGPEFGKSGPLGLAVIVVLLAVTFLLIRSMNKHVRNLPESFEDEAPGEGDEAGGTDHAGIEADGASLTKGDGAPSGGSDGDGGDGPR